MDQINGFMNCQKLQSQSYRLVDQLLGHSKVIDLFFFAF